MLGKRMMALVIGALASGVSVFGTNAAPFLGPYQRRNGLDGNDIERLHAAEAKRARKNAKRLKDAGQ